MRTTSLLTNLFDDEEFLQEKSLLRKEGSDHTALSILESLQFLTNTGIPASHLLNAQTFQSSFKAVPITTSCYDRMAPVNVPQHKSLILQALKLDRSRHLQCKIVNPSKRQHWPCLFSLSFKLSLR